MNGIKLNKKPIFLLLLGYLQLGILASVNAQTAALNNRDFNHLIPNKAVHSKTIQSKAKRSNQSANIKPANIMTKLAFKADSGFIAIVVDINGIKANAMIDTGAEYHVFNTAFLQKHQLGSLSKKTINVKGVLGIGAAPFVTGLNLTLLGQTDRNIKAIALDALSVDVIIGVGFFFNRLIQIDYPQQTLRLLNPHKTPLKQVANLRLQAKGRLFLIDAYIQQNTRLSLVLDTGNNAGIVVSHALAAQANWISQYQIRTGQLKGVMQETKTFVLQIPNAQIGPFNLTNAIVHVPMQDDASNLNQGVHADGLIGYEMLKNFVITLDYSNKLGHIFAR